MAKWWQPEWRSPAPWQRRIGEWFTGPPLPKGASKLEQMRMVRRISGRAMLIYAPILVVGIAFSTWNWFSYAVCALVLLSGANLLSITRKIRRAERAERETG